LNITEQISGTRSCIEVLPNDIKINTAYQ